MNIEALAREAGLVMKSTGTSYPDMVPIGEWVELRRFAALVAERCARIADSEYLTRPPGKHIRAAFPMPKE